MTTLNCSRPGSLVINEQHYNVLVMSDEISNFGQWAKNLHAIMEGFPTDSDIRHITGSLIVLISINYIDYIKSCLRSVSMLTYKVMIEKEKKVKERKEKYM